MLQTTMESRSMKPQALNDWQELSALYEQADALEDADLDIWLTQLRGQGHPLLGQLEQMLDAREQVKRNGFLDAPPALRLEPEPLAHEWHEDSRIGAYRLLRRLGAGGMAEVWLAQRDDGAFQRQVAIKLLFRHGSQLGGATGSTQRDSFAQRFSRERDILASLHHPNIAGLHDAGVTPSGQPWLALEYVEGEPLTEWCNQRQLGIEARVRLFRQVLLAVQHAHANLVIHRDLKPANILVTAQGEVRLLDFGIAKLMEPEGGALVETELTRMAGRPLTVAYASPEQLLGQPLSTACDVYSLGVVLYEMLCGERPYELKVETAAQLEQAILDMEPRAPSRRLLTESTAQARGSTPQALRKQLGSDLDAITLRALGKRPSQRYGSVEALRADIDRWLAGEAVDARTPSALYHLRKFVGRHPVGVSLGVAAILSLVAAAAIAVWQGAQAREESARAVAARDFMLNIFQRADQEKSRGATVTARDLLETGRKDVMARLAGQPKLQAELLEGIARIQVSMGEHTSADGTYAALAQVYAAMGDRRASVVAQLNQADSAVRMSNPVLASRLLQEAKRTLGDAKPDMDLQGRLGMIEGWVSFYAGDFAKAREHFEASEKAFLSSLGSDRLETFDALRGQFRVERALAHFEQALAVHEKLRARAGNIPQIDTKEQFGLEWEHVDVLYAAGHFAEGLNVVSQALARCISSLGPDEQYCRLLLLKKGQLLFRVGLVADADSLLPRLAVLAADQASPFVQAEALLLQFRLASVLGKVEQYPDLQERVRAFGQSGDEVRIRPTFKAAALLALAEHSLREGDAADGRQWADRAMAIRDGDQRAGSPMTEAIGQSLMGISLLQLGRPSEAIAALDQGAAALSRLVGPSHALTQLFALNRALALDRLGRTQEALQVMDQALPVLRASIGENSPTYHQAVSLRERLVASGMMRGRSRSDPSVPRTDSTPHERVFFS
jgi:serine/threonine protein kinase/tetratricopeptide (TPR) repeat protein